MTPEQLRALHDEMDADDIIFGLEEDDDLEADEPDEEDDDLDLEDSDLVDDDGLDDEEAMADEKTVLDHRDPRAIAILEKYEASLSPEQRWQFNTRAEAELQRLYRERDAEAKQPNASPVTKPPVAKPAVAMGIGADGVYRMTNSQARDPAWCARTAAARSGRKVEIIPE
jgi:hypothetical protein